MKANAKCEGKLPNFVSDVCWSCMFPLRIGPAILWSDGQIDNNSSPSGLCSCGNPPKIGLNLGFWEPARIVEVTRTPYCLVTLGGLQVAAGNTKEPGSRTGSSDQGTVSYAFYHVHWYVSPLLHWLGVLLDFDCIERTGFDLAYISELDPTWEDDQLASLLTPEISLVANLPAVAACAADCIATTASWPRDELWWCAGCLGTLLPMTGNVAAHVSGRQSSALLAARTTNRLHRVNATQYTHGSNKNCSAGWYSPRLIKNAYKLSMLLPNAQSKKNKRCCQPFGASPEFWASNDEWPVTGEDFSYLLFRKRDCCVGLVQ